MTVPGFLFKGIISQKGWIMSENKQADRVKEITDQLEAGIQNLFESDRYRQWLTTMSRFHNYSLNNTVLIAIQKPDATLVAGYTAWQKRFGRQVNKGEKGIKILAPAPYKAMVQMDKIDPATQLPVLDENGTPVKEAQEVIKPAFKVVSVFDVSQTDGKELPTIGVNELTGDVEKFDALFEALKRTCPVPIGFENIQNGAKGYYHRLENRIAIQEGMSQLQTIKTAIHEMAHQKLHSMQNDLSSNSKEVEAESVAYTVCQHFGIDTADYSFGYIAGWSEGKETPELKASLQTIRNASKEMINEIEDHLEELSKENSIEAAVYIFDSDKYLDMHLTDDGAWDYTLYDKGFREVDGGQLGEDNNFKAEEAMAEILALHGFKDVPVIETDKEKFEAYLADLTDKTYVSDNQRDYIGDVILQGFDPKEYWVGGKVIDLTSRYFSDDELSDIAYQFKVDSIPKMVYSPDQWKVIEKGISEKLDIIIYADPSLNADQMEMARRALIAETHGYISHEALSIIADGLRSAEEMQQLLKDAMHTESKPVNAADEKQDRKHNPEQSAEIETREKSADKNNHDRKSLLADLNAKKALVSSSKVPKENKINSKEEQL